MKKLLFVLLLCTTVNIIFACTTFFINKNGQLVFGRNYDWITGAGIVNTNQRGLYKVAMSTGDGVKPASWTSKYGSITFNQYGKEFPTGGMNEKGLVVELMWLDGTVYPAADQRPAVGVLQWIQYQLDNATTIAEVMNNDAQIRISEKGTPIHYLVADAGGNVMTVEFLNGKMVIHKDADLPFPVLTNDTYAASIQTAKPIIDKQQDISLPNNSLDRFVKACRMVKKYTTTKINMPVTDYAFSILDKVAQGDFTKWSIVYDISNETIYFKTANHTNIKSFSFAQFDFSCKQPSKMFNMNQAGKGDISKQFILSNKKIKQEVLHQAVAESSQYVTISKKEEEELLGFEEGVTCKQ